MRIYYCLFFLFFSYAPSVNADEKLSVCYEHLVRQMSLQQAADNLYQTCLNAGVHLDEAEYGWLAEITLPENMDNQQLKAIEIFLKDYYTSTASDNDLDFNGLNELLKNILIPEAETKLSLWERFINWLKETLRDESEEATWLGNLVDILTNLEIPDWLPSLLFRGATILMVLLVLYIVANELRIAGVFKRKQQRAATQKELAQQYLHAETLDWQAVINLSGKAQIGALLRYAIQSLSFKNLIPDNSSLTNTELHRYLITTDVGKGALFAAIYRQSELYLYGGVCPDKNELADLQDKTRELTEALPAL